MFASQTDKTIGTDNLAFSNELEADVLYVLQRLEKVIFYEEAVTERNEVAALFANKGYTPLADLYEVVDMDLRVAFLRLQCTAIKNTANIKMTGCLDNIADNIDVVVVDAIGKIVNYDTLKIFDSEWVNKNRAALIGTRYEKLIRDISNECVCTARRAAINANPYE